ncbi:hypothetical protein DCCM_4362 [Desulfocucumis palustris]|uniref:DUF3006 domain-containing protein n=1 Tax=Desulfocucumis palustris TaxID=1898651 RepID=A0A2L2XFW0_9FIRM|nr:DUF3006 domain-containing protein [Desulfocucumis palustris]GBF35239.1 hypothetical protein DCCM_4362 [Desulfocucumis palustris]
MLIIDRFEGEWAVIELGRKVFKIPRLLLPPEAGEGDVVNLEVSLDRESTEKLKRETEKLADSLFEE